jgi:hypothetical protein
MTCLIRSQRRLKPEKARSEDSASDRVKGKSPEVTAALIARAGLASAPSRALIFALDCLQSELIGSIKTVLDKPQEVAMNKLTASILICFLIGLIVYVSFTSASLVKDLGAADESRVSKVQAISEGQPGVSKAESVPITNQTETREAQSKLHKRRVKALTHRNRLRFKQEPVSLVL